MYRLLAHSLRMGVVTERDAFARRPPFGFPVLDPARCTACGDCAAACPTEALRVTPAGGGLGAEKRSDGAPMGPSAGIHSRRELPDGGHGRLELSYAACVSCRECADACAAGAIRPGREHELAAYTRAQLVVRASLAPGGGGVLEAAEGPSLEESAARLRARIHGQLGRSLHVRQVDAGSCNGCELEIAAATQPVYDLERFGIHLVASPRHADLLLVTGPVTRNMELALRRTWEATPEPRIVVAVGACGCTGGVFGEGTYAVRGGVDRVLPVDLYVPGCPPRPQAIVNALLVAMDLRQARATP